MVFHIYFDNVNVHIRNGSGTTYGTVNGRGNLIVGYNEQRSSGNNRTDSHNIVVGVGNNYSSYGGLVAGGFNNISGPFASVSGGYGNTASGYYASVSGGSGNEARGFASTVLGQSRIIAWSSVYFGMYPRPYWAGSPGTWGQ